jgi:hypothetical protein
MNIIIQNLKDNPRTLIRRAGYGERFDSRTGKTSYSRRLDGHSPFPNFHVYLSERDGEVEVSLHLDQKQASYGVGHMHSGDYEGPLVEKELERIKESFENAPAPEVEEPPKKKGLLGRLFG